MRFFALAASVFLTFSLATAAPVLVSKNDKIKPKFLYEADIWYANDKTPGSIGDLLAQNISVPGFSPLYPDAHCLSDGSVCQLTTGESEINAAATISSLIASDSFDLTSTYFLIAGIAGVNPKYASIGDVTFCKYAVQVALQYEFDAREIPSNFSTGYIPQGAFAPDQYPQFIYGTEVFEVNQNLLDIAYSLASTNLPLNDSKTAVAYRANYAPQGTGPYVAATKAPSLRKCDVATSDVYYSGTLLGEAFENTTTLFTNGSGIYCMTAQEDNATLEAMLRGAILGLVDFSRIIIMRTASDFDRPYPGQSAVDNLFYADQGAFIPAIQNIYIAGLPIVKGIVGDWTQGRNFINGIRPGNYIGDIFGSLGGEPDFGPGSITGGKKVDLATVGIQRRDLYKKNLGLDGVIRRGEVNGRMGMEKATRAREG